MRPTSTILNFAHKAVVVSLVGITLFGSVVVFDFGYKVISRVIIHQKHLRSIKSKEEEKWNDQKSPFICLNIIEKWNQMNELLTYLLFLPYIELYEIIKYKTFSKHICFNVHVTKYDDDDTVCI
jgi:hypothetical protein